MKMKNISRVYKTSAFSSIILIRLMVGSVFLSEGIQKFLFPDALGVGRFLKIGIPMPEFFAPFDGVFEILCGFLIIIGLLTKLAAIPMIINITVAILTTKVPMLVQKGFWITVHEARVDFSMLLGLIFLIIVGAGDLSVDYSLVKKKNE
jgi:putative oxidoreductase